MAGAQKKEKEPLDMVGQNKIMVETIKKELRSQKLYLDYSVNPYKKFHILTPKPNAFDDADESEDTHFTEVFKRANLEPTKKYLFPQTEAQEIGWISQPLTEVDKTDRRVYFPKQKSDVTAYMEAAWALSEQTKMNSKPAK